MALTNHAAVLHKKLDMQLEYREIKEPGRGEVQIRIVNAGICGTDVHLWQEGSVGHSKMTSPIILGHECSGVISKVGEGVTHLKIGDRVSIEPLRVCRTCKACVTGRYNICFHLFAMSVPPTDGSLIQYLVHGADSCFKLPDNVSLEEGALIEPLSVALHACRRSRVTVGDNVLILGAGPIGICVMLVAQAFGSSTTVLADLDQTRLEFAKKLGATHTIQVQKGDKSEDVASRITELLGCAPNKAMDCSGAQFCIELGIDALTPGGVFGAIGLGSPNITFPMCRLVLKEIEMIGSIGYIHTWPLAIEMLSSGKIDVKPLITHRFSLQETLKAFETARSGVGVKVMVNCCSE